MKWIAPSAAIAGILLASPVYAADDHVIRPTCWDENVNGEVHHHCEVQRPQRPQTAQVPGRAAQEPPSYPSPQPPTMAAPPLYATAPYGGPPPTSPYGPYGRPWVPGPIVIFRFGPFVIWVP
jgi:hypothetical protein